LLKTLSFVSGKLSSKNITWGVGGSLLLSFYQIIDKPNDIDILVDEVHATKLNKILSSIGESKEALSTEPFCTTYFSKYRINGIDFDVMGGFAIQHDEGIYKISFQQDSILTYKNINGTDIPLCSLEDWYVLYWLIPNKQEKAMLIEKYFKANGIAYPYLLTEALKQPLPLEVKERIKKNIKLIGGLRQEG
jgi:hypothetical protein